MASILCSICWVMQFLFRSVRAPRIFGAGGLGAGFSSSFFFLPAGLLSFLGGRFRGDVSFLLSASTCWRAFWIWNSLSLLKFKPVVWWGSEGATLEGLGFGLVNRLNVIVSGLFSTFASSFISKSSSVMASFYLLLAPMHSPLNCLIKLIFYLVPSWWSSFSALFLLRLIIQAFWDERVC